MSARCIAYRDDGRLCRRPAAVFDSQRGGVVCWDHSPRQAAELPLMLELEAVERLTRWGQYGQARQRRAALLRRVAALRERLLREEGLLRRWDS